LARATAILVASGYPEEMATMKTIKRMIRRRATLVISAVVAAVIGTLMITGCGPGSSQGLANEAQSLLQEYPWLTVLGLQFIENLLEQYGANLIGLLAAAAAALAG
jgi:hypothetical protein